MMTYYCIICYMQTCMRNVFACYPMEQLTDSTMNTGCVFVCLLF